MESNSQCLFCDSRSIKYEGLCKMCKYLRYELPRHNRRIKELENSSFNKKTYNSSFQEKK